VKWLVVFVTLFVLTTSTAQAPTCNLGEFKAIAVLTHHPYERKEKVIAWLKANGKQCDKEQVSKIYNSLAHLLGTADDAEVRAVTYEMYRNAK
jgi:hypothetical protein